MGMIEGWEKVQEFVPGIGMGSKEGINPGLQEKPEPPLPCQGHLPLSQAAPIPSSLALDPSRDPGAATAALGTCARASPPSQKDFFYIIS